MSCRCIAEFVDFKVGDEIYYYGYDGVCKGKIDEIRTPEKYYQVTIDVFGKYSVSEGGDRFGRSVRPYLDRVFKSIDEAEGFAKSRIKVNQDEEISESKNKFKKEILQVEESAEKLRQEQRDTDIEKDDLLGKKTFDDLIFIPKDGGRDGIQAKIILNNYILTVDPIKNNSYWCSLMSMRDGSECVHRFSEKNTPGDFCAMSVPEINELMDKVQK